MNEAMFFMAFIVGVCAAYFLGYFHRSIVDKLKLTYTEIRQQQMTHEEPPIQLPKVTIIDPDDAIQMAQMEHEALMKRLNPDGPQRLP